MLNAITESPDAPGLNGSQSFSAYCGEVAKLLVLQVQKLKSWALWAFMATAY